MSQIRQDTMEWGKQYMPFIALGVCALLCLLFRGGIVGLLMLALGYFIGQYAATGALPEFIAGKTNTTRSEDILDSLPEQKIEKLQALLRQRRDVEAVKQLQAMTTATPAAARKAIELLKRSVGG